MRKLEVYVQNNHSAKLYSSHFQVIVLKHVLQRFPRELGITNSSRTPLTRSFKQLTVQDLTVRCRLGLSSAMLAC